MKRHTTGWSALLLALSTLYAVAVAAEPKPQPAAAVSDPTATITQRLESARPDLRVQSVEPSEIEGMYRVTFTNGGAIHADAAGQYFLTGDLYQVSDSEFVNLTEKGRESARAKILADLSRDDMIIFSPEEETKSAITVFTDVDCFYCQKLHREVPELNRLGIEVRYMAYPRAGIGSDSYKKIVSAWCADDPHDAITKLKNRQSIPSKTCENPVNEQFKLGRTLGVTGTPALFTDSGRLISGYMPSKRLAKTLGVNTAAPNEDTEEESAD